MMLRLILAGFATSMSLELPSVQDATCWAESGRAWATAKLGDQTDPVIRVEPAAESVDASDPVGADVAFRSAQEEMVAAFADDRGVVGGEARVGNAYCEVFGYEVAEQQAAGLGVVGERVAVAETMVAVAPDRAVTGNDSPSGDAFCEVVAYQVIETYATGIADGDVRVAVSDADPESEQCPNVEPLAPVVEDEAMTRAERLAAAVRLTRDAVQAWAAVVDEPAEMVGCGR